MIKLTEMQASATALREGRQLKSEMPRQSYRKPEMRVNTTKKMENQEVSFRNASPIKVK